MSGARVLAVTAVACTLLLLFFASSPAMAPAGRATVAAVTPSEKKPVLAFYYAWYHPSTWCRCTMSNLPPSRYDSGDPATLERQIDQASRAGITGFITSWPGRGT